MSRRIDASAKRTRRRGEGVLSALLGLAITASVLVGVLTLYRSFVLDQRNALIAQQMSRMVRFASDYSVANYATLLTDTGGVGGVTVRTFAQLQAANAIPASIVNTNPLGQGHIFLWRQISANVLEGIVHTYGVRRFADGDMQAIAIRVGAPGGFVSGGFGYNPANMTGAGLGWSIPRASYAAGDAAVQASVGAAAYPGAGGNANGLLVANVSFENLTQSNNYLYRVNVGNTELNTMRTTLRVAGGSNIEMAATGTAGASSIVMNQNAAGGGGIDMNDTDILQARQVDTSDVTLRGLNDSLARAVRRTQIVVPNTVILKSAVDCARGNMADLTPRIDVAAMSLYDSSGRIYSGQDVYVDDNGASWTVRAQLLVPNGGGTQWVDADAGQSRVLVGLRCQ